MVWVAVEQKTDGGTWCVVRTMAGTSDWDDFYIRKTLSLLFVLFLLAASRKSTNSGKYHLLEKRNPLYF
jgi:hypothetical protein